MTSTRRVSVLRTSLLALSAGLALTLAGDGGVAASAIATGIDPLRILDLDEKPNVLVVLDTSSLMNDTPDSNYSAGGTRFTVGGDWKTSKLSQAKAVISQFIINNKTKASFSFGKFTQTTQFGPYLNLGSTTTTANSNPQFVVNSLWAHPGSGVSTTPLGWGARFVYYMSESGTGTAPILGNGTTDVGLYARQIIRSDAQVSNNTLYFTEGTKSCTVTIPGPYPHFYPDKGDSGGGALAADLTTAMNGCKSHGPLSNAYLVVYNGATGTFTFTFTGVNTMTLNWGTQTASSIRGVLAAATTDVAVPPVIGYTTADTRINLLWRGRGNPASTTDDQFTETVAGATSTTFRLWAGMHWNGQTIFVDGNGVACGVNNITGTAQSPPQVTLTQVAITLPTACQSLAPTGVSATFTWGGGAPDTPDVFLIDNIADAGGGSGTGGGFRNTGAIGIPPATTASSVSLGCVGYQPLVPLSICNSAADQSIPFFPFLNPAILLDPSTGAILNSGTDPTNGNAAINPAYLESSDGTGNVGKCSQSDPNDTCPNMQPSGLAADGKAPISAVLNDLALVFKYYYSAVTNPVNHWDGSSVPPLGPLPVLGSGAISGHNVPHERTIVIFVTDADDSCSNNPTLVSGEDTASFDLDAQSAGFSAQLLFTPLAGGDPGSSVTTYMVGYGSGADINRLNAIAWGGSGLVFPSTGATPGSHWLTLPARTDQQTLCPACIDAFVAPTQATLSAILQQVLDQGAKTGTFNAAITSVTTNVFEYISEVASFSPNIPSNRYGAIAPVLFQDQFVLPGFKGSEDAFQCCTLTAPPLAVERWDSGAKLLTRVQTDMNKIPLHSRTSLPGPAPTGVLAGQGTFSQVIPVIDRRIYTTSQNGTFLIPGAPAAGQPADYTSIIQNVLLGASNATTPPGRVNLWPPDTTVSPVVAPSDDLTQGFFDVALGLPPDSTASPATAFITLQGAPFYACKGGPALPVGCTSASPLAQMQRARREAREQILAFLAGATPVPGVGGGLQRITVASGPDEKGEILYQARSWVLAEATFSAPAIVEPPGSIPPVAVAVSEWAYYTDGFIRTGQQKLTFSGAGFDSGFSGLGLRDPDNDGQTPTGTVDGRAIKPVMTVVYQGSNDMLHAFRAGPAASPGCDAPPGATLTTLPPVSGYGTCPDQGGEEIWGFVPFDTLGSVASLLNPQTRANKTYIVASSARFADVFVPSPPGFSLTAGGLPFPFTGVWRRLLFFGRGVGGQYYTALDVTDPGPFWSGALSATTYALGPIPFWSRGNPDTVDGTSTGVVTNTASDAAAYQGMGQTWSVPNVGFVNSAANTTARGGAISFVAYTGSGYGAAAPQGQVFYALDALTGDVVHSQNVDAAATGSLVRSGIPYLDAIVADPAGYLAAQFTVSAPGNFSGTQTTRVYVGDLYGRLWKFVTADPNFTAVPFADVGANQPIGTPVALLGLTPAGSTTQQPFVYLVTGNDNRATGGPFLYLGFEDKADDVTASPLPQNGASSGTSASIVQAVNLWDNAFLLFDNFFPTGFIGNIQPATALNASTPPLGRVFFLGSRFNAPGTPFAPTVPPYPCGSSFDSVLFALGAQSGNAAFNLSTNANTGEIIYIGQNLTGVQVVSDVGTGTKVEVTSANALTAPPAPPAPATVPVTSGGMPNVTMTLPPTAGINSSAAAVPFVVCR